MNSLEWDKLLGLASDYARSELGKLELAKLLQEKSWAENLIKANHLQEETHEASLLLEHSSLWGPLDKLENPIPLLDALSKSQVLEAEHLNLLRGWLDSLDAWNEFPRDGLSGTKFLKVLDLIYDPREELKLLNRILDSDGQLSERASPLLGRLGSKIASTKVEIQANLAKAIERYADDGVLQDRFSDIRDGRYVIPVKIASQAKVEGVVYEASVSRQTVFIEPKGVEILNNLLRNLENEWKQEAYRVLSEATQQLAPARVDFENSFKLLAYWDSVAAKARLAKKYGGKKFQVLASDIRHEGGFKMRQMAHPLLFWSLDSLEIVRNDINIDLNTRALLITGPNTGGKTVLLKAFGLAALCAKTGFFFPASETLKIPFFKSVFVDVGDAQSIADQLSSFSGHILKLKAIAEQVEGNSLILIDEMNTATDPEEGSALSRAFLESMIEAGALIIATTHDQKLKTLGISNKDIEVASMEFNEAELMPTYRLEVGHPGSSRALETASRLGFPATIIEKAKTYLSSEYKSVEGTIKILEENLRKIQKDKNRAADLIEKTEKIKLEWESKLQSEFSGLFEKSQEKIKRMLLEAQEEIRLSVKKMKEVKSSKALKRTADQIENLATHLTNQLKNVVSETAPGVMEKVESKKELPGQLVVGMEVEIPKWKNFGIIKAIDGSELTVAMGKMTAKVLACEIEVKKGKQSPGKKKGQIHVDIERPVDSPGLELDLRGIRYEDAMSRLSIYLDQAYRCDFAEVTIIHGHGTGALKTGTHEVLSKLPYVADFRDAGPGKGGTGATTVVFSD